MKNTAKWLSILLVMLLLGKPLLAKLERIQVKYGMEERL